MMWSNIFGRFSLEQECLVFEGNGQEFLICMNTSLSPLSLLCSLCLSAGNYGQIFLVQSRKHSDFGDFFFKKKYSRWEPCFPLAAAEPENNIRKTFRDDLISPIM